jgi:hypothetical protein
MKNIIIFFKALYILFCIVIIVYGTLFLVVVGLKGFDYGEDTIRHIMGV